ncbi:hypothetical protein TNIN_411881 [Trichonephila inaurata madagascariensis]|uniref:Uncharacterized protein n=1 Tax=Trichonephila inaurata madagascariensis TaxID=2747483 RepID=A0A8X6Y007_9ARAC|nr:hypothetical protein TNIN_411881 [Trichonephila inaurata madagascariensis]
MVECIANFSEEGFSYFCRVCASETKEPGRQFTFVCSRQSVFHCPGCMGTYFEGFKTPKFNSASPSPQRFEVCGNTYQSIADLLRHTCEAFWTAVIQMSVLPELFCCLFTFRRSHETTRFRSRNIIAVIVRKHFGGKFVLKCMINL